MIMWPGLDVTSGDEKRGEGRKILRRAGCVSPTHQQPANCNSADVKLIKLSTACANTLTENARKKKRNKVKDNLLVSIDNSLYFQGQRQYRMHASRNLNEAERTMGELGRRGLSAGLGDPGPVVGPFLQRRGELAGERERAAPRDCTAKNKRRVDEACPSRAASPGISPSMPGAMCGAIGRAAHSCRCGYSALGN